MITYILDVGEFCDESDDTRSRLKPILKTKEKALGSLPIFLEILLKKAFPTIHLQPELNQTAGWVCSKQQALA